MVEKFSDKDAKRTILASKWFYARSLIMLSYKKSKLQRLSLIPGSVWGLGFVSLFMDTSSELIFSLLPIFMTTVLGTSMTAVGFIEGFAEGIALITKIFSGVISDMFQKRKLLTLIGYGLAAATKPLFPLAQGLGIVFTARVLDRIGKGIRGAPRDALIGDIAPKEIRGQCFGLRQSLDTVGAFLGPGLAILCLMIFDANIRTSLWIAVFPAMLSVVILIFWVKEPKYEGRKSNPPMHFKEISELNIQFWILVLIGAILTLARFSEAFLILKAKSVGIPLHWVPVTLILMNIVYSSSAYPAGVLSDRIDRKTILMWGVLFLIAAHLLLGFSSGYLTLFFGIALWGLHMGFSQGLLAAIVTDTTPQHLRGTSYGLYNFVLGLMMFPSSLIAGFLWDQFSPFATFMAGAFFGILAWIGMLLWRFNPYFSQNLG